MEPTGPVCIDIQFEINQGLRLQPSQRLYRPPRTTSTSRRLPSKINAGGCVSTLDARRLALILALIGSANTGRANKFPDQRILGTVLMYSLDPRICGSGPDVLRVTRLGLLPPGTGTQMPSAPISHRITMAGKVGVVETGWLHWRRTAIGVSLFEMNMASLFWG